jgi:hypothetical protein
MNNLHIADDLNLPLEAVTDTFCIVGVRGYRAGLIDECAFLLDQETKNADTAD